MGVRGLRAFLMDKKRLGAEVAAFEADLARVKSTATGMDAQEAGLEARLARLKAKVETADLEAMCADAEVSARRAHRSCLMLQFGLQRLLLHKCIAAAGGFGTAAPHSHAPVPGFLVAA